MYFFGSSWGVLFQTTLGSSFLGVVVVLVLFPDPGFSQKYLLFEVFFDLVNPVVYRIVYIGPYIVDYVVGADRSVIGRSVKACKIGFKNNCKTRHPGVVFDGVLEL